MLSVPLENHMAKYDISSSHSIFSLATPTVGSSVFLFVNAQLIFSTPPVFTHLPRVICRGATPGYITHLSITTSIGLRVCLDVSICGHNTDDSTLIWRILNFPSSQWQSAVTSSQQTESDPEATQNLLLPVWSYRPAGLLASLHCLLGLSSRPLTSLI